MEGFILVLVLSIAMFLGSYCSGYIPLAVNMSESRVRLLSIVGAGLLVGTSLAVILPEGLEALQSSSQLPIKHNHQQEPLHVAKVLEENAKSKDGPPRILPQNVELNSNLLKSKNNDIGERSQRRTREVKPEDDELQKDEKESHEGIHEHLHGLENTYGHGHNKNIGLALLTGFLFMLIVDQITRSSAKTGRHKVTATIGLVVHAAADGIAMGSASAINKSEIQFIVFMAIMLHKAPAAFGLVSFLLMDGLDKSKIKNHLLVFSLAAPLATMITYYALSGRATGPSSATTTGILMLFSAGTFLYVATVHVLPELLNSAKSDHILLTQTPTTSGHSHSMGNAAHFTLKEMGAMIFGAILPLLLNSGHSH